MASTPLYKSVKINGTTVYAFPSAAEDISASQMNTNYKMYFSKYVLINLPAQNLNSGTNTQSKKVYFDFENSFKTSINASPATSYKDSMVESLRNYVANQEVVIKESRLNNTTYYYDTNALETTTEKIFFKWCKKLNLIDFEPAIPEDEYFSNLQEFQSKNINDIEYFPEYLWKEREVVSYTPSTFYTVSPNNLEIEFNGTTNFKVGDVIKINNVTNTSIIGALNSLNEVALPGINTPEGISINVLSTTAAGATQGQKVRFDVDYTGGTYNETNGKAELVYNRLVQYIGEINGVSNVQEANRSYTEVYAHVPDHTGQTPDILFRTMVDVNYKPSSSFPIIPSQFQPEIIGAESFNSPIVNTPLNYPGSYFGQFDTVDFTYDTAPGDDLRRSSDYFGVSGNINSPIVDGSTIDGITMDFNTNHYVKMNLLGRTVTNFDQFDALSINNLPPVDFEFNAILWYYTVEDSNGNARSNLYGVSFLDNPDNNVVETGLRFPTFKKFVTNNHQDGTAYSFNLNLNVNIINENPQDTYNPEAINSMFSMNLFNTAMSRLASTNDSFLRLIAEQGAVSDSVSQLRSLVYTQTDISTINTKISNLEKLLNLYSTNQIVDSDSIGVVSIPGSPPSIRLNSLSTNYERVYVYNATDMYNAQGIIPINLSVPNNRDFLLQFINNDEVESTIEDKLTFVLDKDLAYRQSIDITIDANEFSSTNKKLDIYMRSDINGVTTEVLLIGDISLPIYYNPTSQLPNSAYLWKDFKFNIDLSETMSLISNSKLEVPFMGNKYILNNSIKQGDAYYLNNLFIGTSSTYDYSGQYIVSSISDNVITFDISSNLELSTYSNDNTLPLVVNSATFSILSNTPYFSLNKGKKIRVTRISDSNILRDRYSLNIEDIS
jgi:hypothetical protein